MLSQLISHFKYRAVLWIYISPTFGLCLGRRQVSLVLVRINVFLILSTSWDLVNFLKIRLEIDAELA